MKPHLLRNVAFALTMLLGSAPVHAQVVFDGTFGTSGPAPTGLFRGGTDYLIDQSAGRLVRSPTSGRANLFHSFSQFDVPFQETATFRATESVDTIIARVTSQMPSFIDGRIRSQIPGADLFFVNPAGVFFSSTAQIELPASFHVATADSLRFGDGVTFSSTSTTPSVTSAPPQAFGFMAGPAAEILIAQPLPLRIARGSTLSVIAGTVTIGTNGGTVLVPGGQVQLAGVGSAAAEVPVDLRSWSTRGGDATELGAVRLVGDVTLTTTDSTDPFGNQGGVVIRGGRFEANLAFLTVGGNDDGLAAIDIEVAGNASVVDSNLISRGVRPEGIRISSESLNVSTGALSGIQILNLGTQETSTISIDSNQITLDDGKIGSVNTLFPGVPKGNGKGSDVLITTQSIDLRNGSSIATTTILPTGADNAAGDISITADTVRVESGSEIRSQTDGSAQSGAIDLTSRTSEFSGDSALETLATGINGAGGDAGDVLITTETLAVRSGSRVASRTTGPAGDSGDVLVSSRFTELDGASSIATFTDSTSGPDNDAGDIAIDGESLSLRGGSQIISRTEGSGDAGDVVVSLTGDLSVSDQATVLVPNPDPNIPDERVTVFSGVLSRSGVTESQNVGVTGNSGLVQVGARNIELTRGAVISSRTFGDGNGGQINITAEGTLLVEGSGAQAPATISSSGFRGDGGNISIRADLVDLRNGGRIRATTDDRGDAGDVSINASEISLSGRSPLGFTSQILAESENTDPTLMLGSAGQIDLNATTGSVNLTDGALIRTRSLGNGATNDIRITAADSIRISRGASVTSEAIEPNADVTAGDIVLNAGNAVTLETQASITAESLGQGDAGNIQITSGTLDAVDSSITTNSANELGGNISLESRGRVYLFRSRVTTDVRGGTGQGGDLTVNAQTALFNASTVTANAAGNATAGNIFINVTDGFLQSTNNTLQAENALGIQGEIVVQGPNAQAVGELSQLPANFLDASAQLEEACVARDVDSGSFAVIRDGKFARAPDSLLTSPEQDSGDEGEFCEAPE